MTEASITIRISSPNGCVTVEMETYSGANDEMLDAIVASALAKAKAARDAK